MVILPYRTLIVLAGPTVTVHWFIVPTRPGSLICNLILTMLLKIHGFDFTPNYAGFDA